MPAVITETLKTNMIQSLYNDIADSANSYYIAVGRSEDWDSNDAAAFPYPTMQEAYNFRLAAQAAKRVTDYSFVIPRYNWNTGAIYTAYNDNVTGHPVNSYYVLTDENGVYLCLRQAKNNLGNSLPSTIKPTGASLKPFITTDGYVWKFMYGVGNLSASKFLAANYMPVKLQELTDSNSLAIDIQQEAIQNAAVAGQIAGIEVISGGVGYTSTPSITIIGDGIKAKASPVLSGGTITSVYLNESDATITQGSGYNIANAVVSGGGGSGAKLRVIIGPRAGFAADPRNDLRATAIMLNTKPDGDETGTWIVNNDFRQIGVIKNPKIPVTDSDFTAASGNMLRKLKLAVINNIFVNDRTIEGGISGALAIIDRFDSDTIWYHQTQNTGFLQFTEGEPVTEIDGNGNGILQASGFDADADAYIEPDINKFSGEVLYVENRAAIARANGQIEDIKIIVQL